MQRSTIVISAVFLGLLTLWLVTGHEDTVPELPPLVVEGYLDGSISLQDIKVLNKDEESPYRSFGLRTAEASYTLALAPGQESAKASERKWTASMTRGDTAVTAAGESYRVKMWNQVLARPFRSTHAFRAKPEELAEYGLDDATAVELTASVGSRKVSLRIGNTVKGEGDEPSTWVQHTERKEIVYQVAGHDLRTEVAVGWKDIRDRKILAVNTAAVDKIELRNPRAPQGRGEVVASRAPLTEEQRKQLADGKKAEEVRKSDEGWSLTKPEGFAAGDIGPWLDALERMSLTETYAYGKEPPADSGLGDPSKAVTIVLHEGDKKVVVRLGERAPKGDQQDIYVAIDGDPLTYSIASWSAEQVLKDLDTLRDLRLLGGRKVGAATAVEIRHGSELFRANNTPEGWKSSDVELDPKALADWLTELESTRVDWRPGKPPAEVGLSPPAVTVVLTLPDGTMTIEGSAKVNDRAYGRIDQGDVFELQSWTAERLARRGRDFVDKHLFRGKPEQVTRVVLQSGDKEHVLERTGPSWALAGDAGAKVSSEKVQAWMDSLLQFSYHQEYDVEAKSVGLEPPPWRVELTIAGEVQSLAVSDTRKDNNPYGLLRIGKARPKVATISAMMVDAFRKGLDDLKADAPSGGEAGPAPGP